jgi:non-specific serine/threonine protein kinase
LAVFAGGCTLEAVEAVGAGDGVAADAVLDLLTRLVDQSLVVVEEQGGAARYRLLETVRQYGQERLEAAAEAAAVRDRHRDWFLELAERSEAKLITAAQGAWLERLEAEHDNLRAALGWSAERADAVALVQLAGALWRFWSGHGHFAEGRTWLDRALARADGAPAALRARAASGAGTLAWQQGDFAQAVVWPSTANWATGTASPSPSTISARRHTIRATTSGPGACSRRP